MNAAMMLTPRVFISYARRDGEEFAINVAKRLEDAQIPVWRDRDGIRGGDGWWNQIDHVLDQVEYMVAVLTPGAMVSRIVGEEWERARRKGVEVMPVIGAPDLEWASMPLWMRNTHCYDLEHQATKFVNDLNTRSRQARAPFMVGDLPKNFIARPQVLNWLSDAVLDRGTDTPRSVTAALVGAGGFGKTVMLQAFCRTPTTRRIFYDGVLWTTLGASPGSLVAKLQALLDELTSHWAERRTFMDAVDASNYLRFLLQEKVALIVIDDVWNEVDARPFLVGGPNCSWLIGTRDRQTLPADVIELDVSEMDEEEATRMLVAGLALGHDGDSERLTALARRLGGWPLLLSLVNGQLRDRIRRNQNLADAVGDAETKLTRQGLTAFDRRNARERNQAVAMTLDVRTRPRSSEC